MDDIAATKIWLPPAWNTYDVAGQSACASQAMSGETFAGSNRSNSPGGGG